MRNSEAILEFNLVLNQIATFALTSLAKEQLLNLKINYNKNYIKDQLELLDQAIGLTYKFGPIPLDSIHDIRVYLGIASKDGTLTPESLYRIGSQTDAIKKIINYKKNVNFEKAQRIKTIIEQLAALTELQISIDKCIGPNLELRDQASSELARIRKDIIKKESEVRRKLESYISRNAEFLSDSIITIRNDRLVIPVKATYKFKFGGIIHDQSDSGQTFYVEPEEVVLINAQLSSLKFQESDEIDRILFALSQLVKTNHDVLLLNFELLTLLDFTFAKAKYAKENNAIVAEVVGQQIVKMIKARHPLIDKKKIVANDFYIGEQENKIILITGPNTGGKTVALKTVGLLAMMNQACLPLTVDIEVKLGIFDNFFVDIGDDQSLQHELSTFSSHLIKIIEIIENVTAKSLVLVDELGGGTDPRQGEALAMTILEYFNKKQCLVLATTHYYNLKTFAIEEGYITNSSMAFDEAKIIPTYQLRYGIAGKSYAFEISKKLGLNESIISRAQEYQKRFDSESDNLLKQLDKKLAEAELKNIELSKNLESLNIQLDTNNKLQSKLETELKELNNKAEDKVEELVFEALEQIEQIVDKVRSQPSDELKMHQWIEAKSKLKGLLKEDSEKNELVSKTFEVNETVFVTKLNKIGTIVRLSSKNTYMVAVGNISLEVKANEISKHKVEKRKTNVSLRTNQGLGRVGLELNLIGQRVDEALVNLASYIDSARIAHYQSIRIIHGFGTGALRKAVHNYLDSQRYIKDYRLGGEAEGGHGATVVSLK
jgi:DNA mismatch repair protein MutS2